MNVITQKLKEQSSEGLYHGASLAIYHNGHWHDTYMGTTDGKNPVKSDLIYDLASVSKVVGVATIVAFLINDNKLDIDAPLQHYYPEFHHKTVTVRQLLTHTSGIDPFIPNRNQLSTAELKTAINHITVTDQSNFLYTDINFLLLGFMLETLLQQNLAKLFQNYIFDPWGMLNTSFGPRLEAIPTTKGFNDGVVHDPKAKKLGVHSGSAGLFSSMADLKIFLQHYLRDDFARDLWHNYNTVSKDERSIGWRLNGDWIDHTGYTGPFIMANRAKQQAVIFLTNRTFEMDNRPLWIKKREELMTTIKNELKKF